MKPFINAVLACTCGVCYGAGAGLLLMSPVIGSGQGWAWGGLSFLVAWPCLIAGYLLGEFVKRGGVQ